MQVTVSTDWLEKNHQDVIVLDASWYLPSENRDSFNEFKSRHIPNAQFFDIDVISDTNSPLPHMLPSPSSFNDHVENLGISNNLKIIIYDTEGLFSAARAWWMFKIMGHIEVFILDEAYQNGFLKINLFQIIIKKQSVAAFCLHSNLQA